MPRLSHRTAHDNRNGRNHVNTLKHMKASRPALAAAAAAVIGGLAVGAALSADDLRLADNPFAPAYGHEYRHGAVPTREAKLHMDAWDRLHGASAARLRRNTVLAFGGGIDGIGVTSGTPKVYLVFYGSQWTGGGDPNGAATYLQNLFRGIGTGGELWSGAMTQYCDGPTVPAGASTCDPSTTPHVGYPSSGALAGVWFDTAAPSPSNATAAQLAQEAIRGAGHFGNTTAAEMPGPPDRFLRQLRGGRIGGRRGRRVEPHSRQGATAGVAHVRRGARVAGAGARRHRRTIAVLRHGARPQLTARADPAEQVLQVSGRAMGIAEIGRAHV